MSNDKGSSVPEALGVGGREWTKRVTTLSSSARTRLITLHVVVAYYAVAWLYKQGSSLVERKNESGEIAPKNMFPTSIDVVPIV